MNIITVLHIPAHRTKFAERGFAVKVDSPFKGALVPAKYYRKEKAVTGIMIEINRRLYMNEKTGCRLPEFENIKRTIGSFVSELIQYYRSRGTTNR